MQFKVPDMSCGHCTAAIEKAVKAADPAAQLSFDLPDRKVSVETALASAQVEALLSTAGYTSEPLAG